VAAEDLKLRGVFAVSLGNALAFYDLLIFGTFAVQISRVIYPPASGTTQLLLALGTFGVGFFTRPLGALVIGRIGDRRGRRPAMLISFTLAGVAVLGQALVPPYAAIGLAAPILMLLFRLLLGFAIGGEVGPSTAYLVEAAPPHRRGLVVSLQYATQDTGALMAGIVGFALASLMTDEALTNWGWRVAMLIGASIIPFGLYLRSRLDETLDPAATHARDIDVGYGTRRIALLGFLIIASSAVGSYGLGYLTVYAQTNLGMATELAFAGTIFYGLAAVIFDLAGGIASDRFGRKPVMLFGAVALAATLVPAFMWLNAFPILSVLLIVSFWLSMLNAIAPVAGMVGHHGSFAGSEPLDSDRADLRAGRGHLWRHDPVRGRMADRRDAGSACPAYYVLGVLLVGIAGIMLFPETAPGRLMLRKR
jgi:MFS family permease